MSDEEFDSPQDRIDQLVERADRAADRMDNRSAVRLLLEAQRVAKESENAASYIYLLFRLTNSRDLMDPPRLREWAVELIALLESDDRVRSIQADYDEMHIDWLRSQLTSCAYDNLATHIASMAGYNSAGMHDCIAEGIQVCRRSNKLECVTCFREYATDVYTASDDLDMASHYAQLCIDQVHRENSDDRRYVGYSDLAGIQMLHGRIDPALATLQTCLTVIPDYHSPLDARIEAHHEFARILLIAGRFDEFEEVVGEARVTYDGDAEENRRHHGQRLITDALMDTCQGDFRSAIDKLTPLDQQLSRSRCLNEWFGVRLQLIAAQILSGNEAIANRLATAIEAKATDAQDWLTLRRLRRLLDPNEVTDPLALPNAPEYGPWAEQAATSPERRPDADDKLAIDSVTPTDDKFTEDEERVREQIQALQVAVQAGIENETDNSVLWQRMLDVPLPGRIDHNLIAQLLHLTRFMSIDAGRAAEIWRWTQSLGRMWQDDASVTGLAAVLCYRLTDFESLQEDGLSVELVERMMDRAASLGTDNGTIQKLVGQWYQAEGHDGKAEQALARAFRIDRTDSEAAMALAGMYRQQERPRDALAALDRSGSPDPDILWEAGLAAWTLDKFEPAVTYFAALTEADPERRWSRYYLAIASLELGQTESALSAIAGERAIADGEDYHLTALEATAEFQAGRSERATALVEQLMTVPVAAVDYLSPGGYERIYGLLWSTAEELIGEDAPAFLYELAMHMVRVGYGPDRFFVMTRKSGSSEEQEYLTLFTCAVRQPLPRDWQSTIYCHPPEESWSAYECRWGIRIGRRRTCPSNARSTAR